MKNIKNKISVLILSLVAVFFVVSCEDDTIVINEIIEAKFTRTQDEKVVTFINISENATSYLWDFGDGTTSELINPKKEYENGTYTVTLTATNKAGQRSVFEDTITINVPIPVSLPIDFDGDNVRYNDIVTFNGVAFSIVDNPDSSGSNDTASKVGSIVNAGAQFEGFYYDLETAIDLTIDKSIVMDVWSDAPTNALLKLENGSAPAIELFVDHGGTGWEEMIFTFANSSASYSRLTMFIDPTGTAAKTYFIDNINQVPTIDNVAPVITLNGNATISLTQGETFTDPGFTATDNLDGDITANVVVGGDTVDTNTTGTYIITYNVSDAAGNAANEVTRTVEVSAIPTSPTTSAPIPPSRNASDVISIYGESYATIPIGNYDPNWGQTGHTLVNTAFDPGDGNLVLAYPNFNYQGTDFGAAGPVNAEDMEYLHIDIWVASTITDRAVKVSPINGSGVGEVLVEVPVTPGSWNSVDLPKSAFTGMTWDNVVQMKFDGQFNADGSANTTPYDIYLDNIYFYKEASVGNATEPNVAAPAPPTRNAEDVISVYSDSYATIPVENYDPNWGQAGHTLVNTTFDPGNGNFVLAYPNFNYQGTDFGAAGPVNAQDMEFLHVDIWVAASNSSRAVKVSPINSTGVGEVLVEIPLTPGAWNSVDLPKSAFTGMTWDSVVQMKFDGQFNADGSANTTPYDIYLDNIYFYKSSGTGGGGGSGSGTGPSVAAPTPPARSAENVISLYSDAYDNITVSEWSAPWDDADIVDGSVNGDNIKKINFGDNGGFLGVDFSANSFDASSFTHFHMDIWVTDDLTAGEVLNPKWSNHANGAEINAFEFTNPITQSGTWISIDIPISSFNVGSTVRDNLSQFILAGSNTIDEAFIDNIYFYKD